MMYVIEAQTYQPRRATTVPMINPASPPCTTYPMPAATLERNTTPSACPLVLVSASTSSYRRASSLPARIMRSTNCVTLFSRVMPERPTPTVSISNLSKLYAIRLSLLPLGGGVGERGVELDLDGTEFALAATQKDCLSWMYTANKEKEPHIWCVGVIEF